MFSPSLPSATVHPISLLHLFPSIHKIIFIRTGAVLQRTPEQGDGKKINAATDGHEGSRRRVGVPEEGGATAITYEGCGPCGPGRGRRSSSGCHGGRRHATVAKEEGGGAVVKEEGHGQQGSTVRSWRLAVLCFLSYGKIKQQTTSSSTILLDVACPSSRPQIVRSVRCTTPPPLTL